MSFSGTTKMAKFTVCPRWCTCNTVNKIDRLISCRCQHKSGFLEFAIKEMIKYTPQYLKKLEDFLKENGYEVRYEKGNFKSGYCILEAKKVVVVNKFATIESRIQSLFEISQALMTQGKIHTDSQELFIKAPKEKKEAEPVTAFVADVEQAEDREAQSSN
jgi:hypothetical protein